MKSRILLAGVLLACFGAQSVIAADYPQPVYAPQQPQPVVVPPYTWTGVYIGINGGYGNAAFGDVTATTIGTVSRGSAKGGIVGGQIGANYQVGAGVFGIEADGQWSGQTRTSTIICGGICAGTETAKITSFATLRGRAGLASDRALFYATAGGAWTSASDQIVGAVAPFNGTLLSVNGNKVFHGNWSIKAEYLYIATNNISASSALPFGLGTLTESGNIRDNVIRVGINYRFGPTGLVAY